MSRGDGSVITVEVAGQQGATPVLFCHGLADSRLSAHLFAPAARELGLCLVAPDRPGIGRTDPRRLRRLADWAEDAALVLDALGAGPAALLGVSAGGPFAAACAARLGVRVSSQIELWGKYLAEELPAIYGEQAAAVVVFVSGDYAARDWTRLERRAALDRAVRERREFVLPARFDDTALPGLLMGMVAIDLRNRTPKQFASMIVSKLAALGITGPAPPADAGDPAQAQNTESRVPRRDSGEYRRSALDDVADLLARAVKEQWSAAAVQRRLQQTEPIPVRWERSSKPVVGPAWAALRSQRFTPLPGLERVGPERLDEGGLRDLHAIYGGLGSGRLVIVGAPGSGKTGAAVLLVLAALEHREQVPGKDRPQVPVPVLLTLHGWDPETQDVEAWQAKRLQRDYRLFAGEGGAAQAAELVRTGRVAILLDGLDEIPEQLRPVALDALSRQDAVRIVVLARSTEMADAVQHGLLEKAVALELQDVDPLTAADYLTRIQLDPAPRAGVT